MVLLVPALGLGDGVVLEGNGLLGNKKRFFAASLLKLGFRANNLL